MEAMMRRSKSEHYFHMVWATAGRRQLITRAVEERVYRCIGSEIVKLSGAAIAIGGMPDHVHLLASLPAKVPISKVMQKSNAEK